MPSSVPVLAILRYTLRRAGEDHPDVQGSLGCTRLVMAPQPPSAKNGTLQSDMDIPGKRDWHQRPPPPKHSDNDDDFAVDIYLRTKILLHCTLVSVLVIEIPRGQYYWVFGIGRLACMWHTLKNSC